MSDREFPIPFTALVARLPAAVPFVGPETLERSRGQQFKARIGANESAFGLSPKAVAAMGDAIDASAWYGDPENYQLRARLAQLHHVAIDEICVDAGIDSLLGLTVRMLAGPDTPVVTSLGAYPTFIYHVNGFGAELVTVPYRDNREDPEALIAATIQHRAPLVYLANPDNPMGTWHEAAVITSMIDELPTQTVLALDEAYIEFADERIAPPIDTSNPQVLRLRTFSKAYGMAGLRIGYAVGHRDLITGLNKVRNHFAVNRLAQIGALASLDDVEFLASVKHAVDEGRERIYTMASNHGLSSLRSLTNFVAVDLESAERAQAMLAALAEHDIFMRMPGVAPLNQYIRVGIGTTEESAHLESVFAGCLESLRV